VNDLTDEAFDRILDEHRLSHRRHLLEVDLALTHIVRYNCAVTPADKPVPRWALTGGFAIRHCYASDRLSRDSDLAYTEELALDKTADSLSVACPTGFSKIVPPVPSRNDGDPWSQKVEYHYERPWGRGTVQLDLNRKRRLRGPAVRMVFTSLFIESFEVWTAPTSTLLADKLAGLIRFASTDSPRVRDIPDLNCVFRRGVASEVAAEVERLLRSDQEVKHMLLGARKEPLPIADVVAAALRQPAMQRTWDVQLPQLMDRPPRCREASAELLQHIITHFGR